MGVPSFLQHSFWVAAPRPRENQMAGRRLEREAAVSHSEMPIPPGSGARARLPKDRKSVV